MEKYLKTNVENKEIKIEVCYNKGGFNYFTGTQEKRGYYLSVCPVTIEHYEIDGRQYNSVSYTGFTGIKELIKETKRATAKVEQGSYDLAQEMEKKLVDYILTKENLKLV